MGACCNRTADASTWSTCDSCALTPDSPPPSPRGHRQRMSNPLARRGGQPLSRYTLMLWQRSRRGRRLLALEERELRRVLPDLFGRHILQIGNWGRGQRLLAAADMLHRAVLGTIGSPGVQSL